jgi:protein-tyrosine phosphatase
MKMTKRVLFICTGNYYRSRFARGLAIHLLPDQFVLSPQTEDRLVARQIDLRHTAPGRAQLSEADLQAAECIVALKEDEHRPMVRKQFPHWEKSIVFWDVGDQPEVRPEDALPAVEHQVYQLIEELRTSVSERAA